MPRLAAFLQRLPLLNRIVPSVKKRYARSLWPNGFTIARAKSAWFLLNYDNYVDRQLAFYGGYEDDRFDYFLERMQALNCDVFFDVGGNIGYYSIPAALRGCAKRVVAFEPDRRNIYQFEANILINGLVDRIELIPKAVSSVAGSVGFAPASRTSTGESRVVSHLGAESVEAVTLDLVAPDLIGKNLFLKIDVEGHECEVIKGAAKLLASNHCFLQIESFSPNDKALRTLMESGGFRYLRSAEDDHYFSNH